MKKLVSIFAFLFLQIQSVWACTCFNPEISSILNRTDAIFFGKVVGFERVYRFPDGEIVYFTEFEVIRYWHKDGITFKEVPQYVSVAQTAMATSCGIQNFEIGKKYLLYAPYSDGFLQTAACGYRVLEETYRKFHTDIDSLKILGFQKMNVTTQEGSFSVTKRKKGWLEYSIDTLRSSHQRKLDAMQARLDRHFYYEIFGGGIFLLAITLLIFFKSKQKL